MDPNQTNSPNTSSTNIPTQNPNLRDPIERKPKWHRLIMISIATVVTFFLVLLIITFVKEVNDNGWRFLEDSMGFVFMFFAYSGFGGWQIIIAVFIAILALILLAFLIVKKRKKELSNRNFLLTFVVVIILTAALLYGFWFYQYSLSRQKINNLKPHDFPPPPSLDLSGGNQQLPVPVGGKIVSDWQTYRNDQYDFEFQYSPNLYVNKSNYGNGDNWWFVTQEPTAPVFSFEDSCGLSKDYLNIQVNDNYKDVYVWSKYDSIDSLIRGLEFDFDSGNKISDQIIGGIRIVRFSLRGYDNYYLIKGVSIGTIQYTKCVGGNIPTSEIVSTFKFTK